MFLPSFMLLLSPVVTPFHIIMNEDISQKPEKIVQTIMCNGKLNEKYILNLKNLL